MPTGPIDTRHSPYARLHAPGLDDFRFADGFWSARQDVNRRVGLHHGYRQLEESGNFNNLLLAAGRGTGVYRTPVFMDSDVYKWLEAVGYALGMQPAAELTSLADHAIRLVQDAQGDDGYLNSYWQVIEPARRWQDLQHGHELYCAGHLFQAAVAYVRGTGDDRLLSVARRFADYIDSIFGPGKRTGTPGHPEVETALIELYRETQEPRYLRLAQYFLDQRGHGLLGSHRLGSPAYYQDHVPVRDATTVEGHAVRQLYLTAGVTDLYLETGETALLAALDRQWHDMTARKLHVTGGLGANHMGEAFGEPYELPNDRAYCETCAQIASIHWNWRMLLATGERRFADLMEHTLYNAFLSGVSLDGRRYFYVNPLHSRGVSPLLGRKRVERPEWHGCACCPPNVMRLLASLQHYVCTVDGRGVQLHQYANGSLALPLDGAELRLTVVTGYPWHGQIAVRIDAAPPSPCELRFRIPGWCSQAQVRLNDTQVEPNSPDGYVALDRIWRTGDVVRIELDMPVMMLAGHPRVDPVRGSVALQRGPLVYCFEQIDQGAGVDIQDALIQAAIEPAAVWRPDLLGGVMQVEAAGCHASMDAWEGHLYRLYAETHGSPQAAVTLRAIPYYAWANRGPNAMRVWIPVAR
jgi:DUF1680 family protein